jgi:hypothetical protein
MQDHGEVIYVAPLNKPCPLTSSKDNGYLMLAFPLNGLSISRIHESVEVNEISIRRRAETTVYFSACYPLEAIITVSWRLFIEFLINNNFEPMLSS